MIKNTKTELRKNLISQAMFENKINKRGLEKKLGYSYPTILYKLKNLGSMSFDDTEKLCEILNIDFVKYINPLNDLK